MYQCCRTYLKFDSNASERRVNPKNMKYVSRREACIRHVLPPEHGLIVWQKTTLYHIQSDPVQWRLQARYTIMTKHCSVKAQGMFCHEDTNMLWMKATLCYKATLYEEDTKHASEEDAMFQEKTTNDVRRRNVDQKPPSADRQAILQRYLGPPENTLQMPKTRPLTWQIFYGFETFGIFTHFVIFVKSC